MVKVLVELFPESLKLYAYQHEYGLSMITAT